MTHKSRLRLMLMSNVLLSALHIVEQTLCISILKKKKKRKKNALHIDYETITTILKKKKKIPVPNMDTLRKMYFFHPRVHLIGLQKCMTTISGLLTKKFSNLVIILI